MWELYDELIDGITENIKIKRYVSGNFWTVVESDLGVGVAGTARVITRPPTGRFSIAGAPLKQAAELSKSWNLVEASIGVAALNSYYNSPEIASQNGTLFSEGDDRLNDPYIAYRNFARGKRVACMGHDSTPIDSLLKDVAEVAMFGEQTGAYPLAAVDYLFPEFDLIYLPCYSEVIKSLPHYLELGKNSTVVICGPSITMSPTLFKYGAFDMAGLVVTDPETAFESACGTAIKKMFAAGKKASLRRGEIRSLR